MRGISSVAEELSASQEALCSMELLSSTENAAHHLNCQEKPVFSSVWNFLSEFLFFPVKHNSLSVLD
jgi:hypothetical protein